MILLPVIVNIMMMDAYVIHWNLRIDALRIALYVLAALLAILGFHSRELIEVFWRLQKRVSPLLGRTRWVFGGQCVVVLAMFVYTAHQGYWLANVNNRRPTPLDGAWQVDGTNPTAPGLPRTIYFEYNRASLCVFRQWNGGLETHGFRVDAASHTVSITQQWLRRSPVIFQGNWSIDDNVLTLAGYWQRAPMNTVKIKLMCEEMPVKDHQ